MSVATDTPLIEMSGIVKEFPGVAALRGVDLDIRAGEVHAVLGENGAGKSTLVKILSGVYRPTRGSIRVAGETVDIDSPQAARKFGIGAIHQELALVRNLSVADNIFLGRELKHRGGFVDRDEVQERSTEILARVGASFSPSTIVGQLSIGQQQMVEIGRALSEDARVLILDEPTASLAEHETDKLYEIVEGLRERGIAIVYISHRLAEIQRLADRVTVLRDGQRVATRPSRETTQDEVVRLMVGRTIENFYVKSDAPIGDVVLKVEGLLGDRLAAPVSFEVRAGEVLGFAGLVGAGRTEVARLLFGADPIRAGKIWVDGKPVRIRQPSDAIRAGISLVPESRKEQGLFLQRSVADNITVRSIQESSRLGFVDRRRQRAEVDSAFRELGIRAASASVPVGSLSGGNQQKVSVAKWLFKHPRVLLLDEPTRGVDVGAKLELYRAIGELAAKGTAIVLISSELLEVLGISDRIVVMRAGRQVAELDADGATQALVMTHAVGGE